jgi:predicted metal-dependent enzyme (double-stranded beta helix superfamily)
MTFAIDQLVADCKEAIAETQPALAVRDVLRRALEKNNEIAEAFNAQQGALDLIHVADDLTVAHVTWAPGMRLFPHNHDMWAVIGIYGGREDNAFYRRDGRTLVESGGKSLHERDIVVLGDDTIHSVSNPLDRLTGAIHVYGGDFVNRPRSQWPPEAYEEEPYKYESVREEFARANALWRDVTLQ